MLLGESPEYLLVKDGDEMVGYGEILLGIAPKVSRIGIGGC